MKNFLWFLGAIALYISTAFGIACVCYTIINVYDNDYRHTMTCGDKVLVGEPGNIEYVSTNPNTLVLRDGRKLSGSACYLERVKP